MPVDKFGRRFGDMTQETSSSDVTITQMSDYFLRRDGTNTTIGSINMTGNTLMNVSKPVANHDAANKAYIEENVDGVSKSGDTMSGDLNMDGNRTTGLPTRLPA